MKDQYIYPRIDDEEVRLRAEAMDRGMLKLAIYGTKEELLILKKWGWQIK